MSSTYPNKPNPASEGWTFLDGRKLSREEYPELLEAIRKERIWIHRRLLVSSRRNKLRMTILKALIKTRIKANRL